MYLEIEKFVNMFEEIERSAFRLQLLNAYSVEFEKEDYDSFIAGKPLPDRENVPWLQTISRNIAAGHEWINVDFWYLYHAKSGADIRFLLGDAAKEIRALAPKDYWLFDDNKLVWMDYDQDGRFLGPLLSVDVRELALARQIRDKAVRSSIELTKLLALRRQGLLT